MVRNEIRRYNPFFNMFDDLNPDKFYDNEPSDFVESVENLSKVLEDCKNYTYEKLGLESRSLFSVFKKNINRHHFPKS